MTEQPDADLRARFRALATEDAGVASVFSDAASDARRARLRERSTRRSRRAWYTATALTAATAAAALTLIVWPSQPPYPIQLDRASWQGPSDFLLDTPGRSLLQTVPAVGVPAVRTATTTSTAAEGGDTSGRKQ